MLGRVVEGVPAFIAPCPPHTDRVAQAVGGKVPAVHLPELTPTVEQGKPPCREGQNRRWVSRLTGGTPQSRAETGYQAVAAFYRVLPITRREARITGGTEERQTGGQQAERRDRVHGSPQWPPRPASVPAELVQSEGSARGEAVGLGLR